MLTFAYDAHKNKKNKNNRYNGNNKNNDKRVVGIAWLCLSALLKMMTEGSHCLQSKCS